MSILNNPRPNLKNLNLVAELPKTSSYWARAQILKHWIQYQMEPTMFMPRHKFKPFLKFEIWYKFFKFVLCLVNFYIPGIVLRARYRSLRRGFEPWAFLSERNTPPQIWAFLSERNTPPQIWAFLSEWNTPPQMQVQTQWNPSSNQKNVLNYGELKTI